MDLDLNSLIPKAEDLETTFLKYQGRVKIFVLSYIFGAHPNIDSLIKVCQKHSVLFIEDSAEVWAGPGQFLGSNESDVVLFSFGTIKTTTSLGGAIGRFNKSADLHEKVNQIIRSYPIRSNSVDARRFAKYAVLNPVTQSDRAFGTLLHTLKRLNQPYDQMIRTLSRGFSRDMDLFPQLRFQVTVPTLKLMLRQMKEFDYEKYERRRENGRFLMQELSDAFSSEVLTVPGVSVAFQDKKHEFWLFPICIETPGANFRTIEEKMMELGFDVTGGTTQLSSLDMIVMDKLDPEFTIPEQANHMMERILYLPFDDQTNHDTRKRLVKALKKSISPDDGFYTDEEDSEDLNAAAIEDELNWVDSDDEEAHHSERSFRRSSKL